MKNHTRKDIIRSNSYSTSFFSKPSLQRKEEDKASFFQPKLKVGKSNDKYEQEADAMASKVMGHQSVGAASASSGIQRMEAQEEEELMTKPEIQKEGMEEEEEMQM